METCFRGDPEPTLGISEISETYSFFWTGTVPLDPLTRAILCAIIALDFRELLAH